MFEDLQLNAKKVKLNRSFISFLFLVVYRPKKNNSRIKRTSLCFYESKAIVYWEFKQKDLNGVNQRM